MTVPLEVFGRCGEGRWVTLNRLDGAQKQSSWNSLPSSMSSCGEVAPTSVAQTSPSTPAGSHDDVSLNKLPQTRERPRTADVNRHGHIHANRNGATVTAQPPATATSTATSTKNMRFPEKLKTYVCFCNFYKYESVHVSCVFTVFFMCVV